jgi:hypothetical protein
VCEPYGNIRERRERFGRGDERGRDYDVLFNPVKLIRSKLIKLLN